MQTTERSDRDNAVLSAFGEAFGSGGSAALVRAPGRVNLIGEHTDYNGGYVLPMAIDRAIRIALRPTGGAVVDLVSRDFDGRVAFDLGALAFDRNCHWANYPQGVAWVLQDAGHELSGFQGVVAGDVPIGAGLSSSAAFEVAAALAFAHASGLAIAPAELARLCQRAENEFVGVRCGIMDQFVSLHAQEDHAIFLDCTTLEHEVVPLDSSRAQVVVADTGVHHSLAASEYNRRRAECEEAFDLLREDLPDAETYRDISVEQFAALADKLPEVIRRRARHVIHENQRVLDSMAALREGDLGAFGALMNASHESLRDDYEVSCEELDIMVALALEADGVFGSRMTGGGFGGCTVALVANDAVPAFCDALSARYKERTGREPAVYVCRPAAGAGVVQIEPS